MKTYKEKLEWIINFYNELLMYPNSKIEYLTQSSRWIEDPAGPDLKSNYEKWRIQYIPREVWINEYENKDIYVYNSREDALLEATVDCSRAAINYVEKINEN